ncbi:MAG: hypothetical protein ACK4G4_07260 [Thermus sp.]|uniref:hypothetical protein n=1 Tax=Thermus sp. TaxID=275 RepID=UPI0039197DAB
MSLLKALEDRVVAETQASLKRAEAQALSQVPAQVVARLEGVRLKLKEALQVGIVEALRGIFLLSTFFIGLSLVALVFLPDRELSGGLGPRPSLE